MAGSCSAALGGGTAVGLVTEIGMGMRRDVTGIMNRGAHFPVVLANDLTRALAWIDTAPRSIIAADRAQSELLAVFDRHGHAAGSFLRIYHGITVAVITALDNGSLVPGPLFERLAGRFAEKHFSCGYRDGGA